MNTDLHLNYRGAKSVSRGPCFFTLLHTFFSSRRKCESLSCEKLFHQGTWHVADAALFGTTTVVARARRPPPTVFAAALNMRMRLNPVERPRRVPVREVLTPSLRAHIKVFGIAAATKCSSPQRTAMAPINPHPLTTPNKTRHTCERARVWHPKP